MAPDRKGADMLTIYVGPTKEGIVTVDKKHMTVLKSTIRRGLKNLRLNDVQTFPSVTSIRIIGRVERKRIAFNIPSSLQEAIRTFLISYHGKTDLSFDCYAFANLVAGMPQHRCTELLGYWDIENGTELQVGGTIFFLDPDTYMFFHAAIYLGQGLYISVYGAGGDLEFSTMGDMRRDFGGVPVFALPRAVTP